MPVTRVFHKVTSLGSPHLPSPPSSLPPSLSLPCVFSPSLRSSPAYICLVTCHICVCIYPSSLSFPSDLLLWFFLSLSSYLRSCPRLGGSRVGTMTLPLHVVVCTRPAPSLTPSLLFIPLFFLPSIYRASVHPSRDDLLLTAMPLKVIKGINELRSQACVGV